MENTIPGVFFNTAKHFPDKPALLYKKEGVYFPVTYQELAKDVKIFAIGFENLGVKKGDTVAILSENRPEWVKADLAIMSLGAITVPLHATFSHEAIAKILNHCQAKIVVVASGNLLNKILLSFKKLEYLEKIIFLDKLSEFQKKSLGSRVVSWKNLYTKSKPVFLQRQQGGAGAPVLVNPDDCASVIYTSGTMGDPQGVALSHNNFLSNIEAINKAIPVKKDDVFLSFLPLSHVLERTGGYYTPLLHGATIAYAQNIKSLAANLKEVCPTILICVPRIFEKLHDAVWDKVNASSGFRKNFFYWALKQKRGTLRFLIADRFVFRKIRKQLGGNFRLAISGGASLHQHISQFFLKIGVLILEGYGLTETSPVIAVNRQNNFKFGSVGQVLDGVEVKISEEKEVLVRGPNVAMEYYRNKKLWVEVCNNGWFHTGDLGFMDREGFLTIIGRKKEMIVLSLGKKVWPESVENVLNNDKYISQSVVIGNHQKFISALMVPDWQEIAIFFKKNDLPMQSPERMVKNPAVLQLFQDRLDQRINDKLSDVEKVKKFIILFQELSQERGELTPTLKLRRHIIDLNYKKLIDSLYEQA